MRRLGRAHCDSILVLAIVILSIVSPLGYGIRTLHSPMDFCSETIRGIKANSIKNSGFHFPRRFQKAEKYCRKNAKDACGYECQVAGTGLVAGDAVKETCAEF